jgi:hypothetical protein
MARTRTADDELQAIDPLTGDPIASLDDEIAAQGPPAPRARRALLLHRLTALFVVLSLAAAGGAVYVGAQIRALRSLERTWRTALAIDDERAALDRTILDGLEALGNREDLSGRTPIGTIGADAEGRLGKLQHDLERASEMNGRLDRLRKDMIEALQFRRYQMTPDRLRIGDSPLRKVDAELALQLRRSRLRARPLARRPAPLRTSPVAARFLATYADGTAAVLVGERDGRLVIIDVAASRTTVLRLDGDVTGAFAVDTLAVGVAGGRAVAFDTRHPDDPAVWQAPADASFPDSHSNAIFVVAGGAVTTLVPSSGQALHPPTPLPPGAVVVGASHGRLVLLQPPAAGVSVGRLTVWDPPSGTTERVLTDEGRLVAAGSSRVAWQGPASAGTGDSLHVVDLLHQHPDAEILLPRTDAGTGVFSASGDTLAFTAGPLAGDRAAVLIYDFDDGGALRGLGEPATTIDAGLAWSADGGSLFWPTREGRIVYTTVDNGARARLLRIGPPPPSLRSLSSN